MTDQVKPMDREAWEKRIGDLAIEYYEFRVDDHYRSSPHSERVWDIYSKSKSQVVDSILALQSSNETLTSEACTLNNRIEEIDRTYNFQREEDAAKLVALQTQLTEALAEVERLKAQINTPEVLDFVKAVQLEAAHQRERWPSDHDAGKTNEDWFWLVGYLAGKALHSLKSGNSEKGSHHIITTAAALANWHSAHLGGSGSIMRPGINPDEKAKKLK